MAAEEEENAAAKDGDEAGDEGDGDSVKARKRKERLEQNRISARESRKRKKTMIEELQRTVITLSRENKELNERNEGLRRQLMEIGTKYPNVVPMQAIMGGPPAAAAMDPNQAAAAAAAAGGQPAAAAAPPQAMGMAFPGMYNPQGGAVQFLAPQGAQAAQQAAAAAPGAELQPAPAAGQPQIAVTAQPQAAPEPAAETK